MPMADSRRLAMVHDEERRRAVSEAEAETEAGSPSSCCSARSAMKMSATTRSARSETTKSGHDTKACCNSGM